MQVELVPGKDLNTFKGPNTQVPAKCSFSKQIVSQLLYVGLTQILHCTGEGVQEEGDLLTPGPNQRG